MLADANIQRFNRQQPWMIREVIRIAKTRFDPLYSDALQEALTTCLENHSVVVVHPNKEKSLTAFVLVCPPTTPSADRYGIRTWVQNTPLEIAFCATDVGWEGRGYARRMFSYILMSAQAAKQGCWLHVDTDNWRARGLYESLGFKHAVQIPDPVGSDGVLMRWFPVP